MQNHKWQCQRQRQDRLEMETRLSGRWAAACTLLLNCLELKALLWGCLCLCLQQQIFPVILATLWSLIVTTQTKNKWPSDGYCYKFSLGCKIRDAVIGQTFSDKLNRDTLVFLMLLGLNGSSWPTSPNNQTTTRHCKTVDSQHLSSTWQAWILSFLCL